jgi:hypothetical protein
MVSLRTGHFGVGYEMTICLTMTIPPENQVRLRSQLIAVPFLKAGAVRAPATLGQIVLEGNPFGTGKCKPTWRSSTSQQSTLYARVDNFRVACDTLLSISR